MKICPFFLGYEERIWQRITKFNFLIFIIAQIGKRSILWSVIISLFLSFSTGALSVYYNLHRLSRLFKDQVAYPLLSFMRAGEAVFLFQFLVLLG